MGEFEKGLTSAQAGDAGAVRHFVESIGSGKNWYIALLESMGLWASPAEDYDGRKYSYLIDEEAFDWLLLAERLCEAVNGLLPSDEKDALLFHGRPPLYLAAPEVEQLIGSSKFHQYLNYFYGVTVEEFLQLAVQEEVHKSTWMSGCASEDRIADESFRQIYDEDRKILFECFRKELGYASRRSTTLAEEKEFTYWLFKRRVRQSEKARVASDTRKALQYLERQRASGEYWGALVADGQMVGRNLSP